MYQNPQEYADQMNYGRAAIERAHEVNLAGITKTFTIRRTNFAKLPRDTLAAAEHRKVTCVENATKAVRRVEQLHEVFKQNQPLIAGFRSDAMLAAAKKVHDLALAGAAFGA